MDHSVEESFELRASIIKCCNGSIYITPYAFTDNDQVSKTLNL
jgi:hypothetical protein